MTGADETFVLGEGNRAVEFGPAHVFDRLCKQQRGTGLEELMHFAEEIGLVADFVQHGEGEGKIKAVVLPL